MGTEGEERDGRVENFPTIIDQSQAVSICDAERRITHAPFCKPISPKTTDDTAIRLSGHLMSGTECSI